MRIHFFFASSDIIQTSLEFDIEWSLPYLPRMGEDIGPSVIMSKVTPEKFREGMTYAAAEKWDKQVGENLTGCTREEYERTVMCDWLIEMNMRVTNVLWCLKDGKYYASMMLMEEGERKEAADRLKCPLCR